MGIGGSGSRLQNGDLAVGMGSLPPLGLALSHAPPGMTKGRPECVVRPGAVVPGGSGKPEGAHRQRGWK